MVTIKEKAEEYTSDITNPVTNNAAFLAYKAGANYVLEVVENALEEFSNYEDSLIVRRIIKQLKI